MKFKLEIACDNAAFGDTEFDRETEVARILQTAVNRLENGSASSTLVLMDINGNKVGTAEFVE